MESKLCLFKPCLAAQGKHGLETVVPRAGKKDGKSIVGFAKYNLKRAGHKGKVLVMRLQENRMQASQFDTGRARLFFAPDFPLLVDLRHYQLR